MSRSAEYKTKVPQMFYSFWETEMFLFKTFLDMQVSFVFCGAQKTNIPELLPFRLLWYPINKFWNGWQHSNPSLKMSGAIIPMASLCRSLKHLFWNNSVMTSDPLLLLTFRFAIAYVWISRLSGEMVLASFQFALWRCAVYDLLKTDNLFYLPELFSSKNVLYFHSQIFFNYN